jgi:hypothetical protein
VVALRSKGRTTPIAIRAFDPKAPSCQGRTGASRTAAIYVRDVSFFEDHSRIRTKPTVFARCRSFALNILRANRAQNISRELYLNALNLDHAMTYPIT